MLQVTEGCGKVLVLAVGVNSEWGKTMAMCQSEAGETPLQQQLEKMAGGIAKLGLGVAAVCFVVLMLRCVCFVVLMLRCVKHAAACSQTMVWGVGWGAGGIMCELYAAEWKRLAKLGWGIAGIAKSGVGTVSCIVILRCAAVSL